MDKDLETFQNNTVASHFCCVPLKEDLRILSEHICSWDSTMQSWALSLPRRVQEENLAELKVLDDVDVATDVLFCADD